MTTRVISFGLGLVAIVGFAGAPAAARLAGSKSVLVSVVASPSGPVKDLTAADFGIQEDKTPVQVTDVTPASEPLFVTFVLDTTQPLSTIPPTQELRRAVSSFITTVHGGAPDAQFSILQVSNAATPLTDFTNTPSQIDNAIGHLVIAAQTGSVMLEGIVKAAQGLADKPSPRRAIVCVSFGSAEAGSERPSSVADDIQKSGATLWTVSVTGSGDVAQAAARDEVYAKLTAASGGMGLDGVEVTGLDNQMKTIANTLLSQYSLTFTRKADGAVKPLKGQTTKGSKVLFTRWMR